MISLKSCAFALTAADAMLLSAAAYGQTLTTIHSFRHKGQHPYSGVLNVGSRLFGTTLTGGASDRGSVYRIRLAGGNTERSFHDFTGTLDGAEPFATLIRVGEKLYGTTTVGGVEAYDSGTAFKVDLDGSNFTILHTFRNGRRDARQVAGRLIYSDGYFYGTSERGGPHDAGTVFKMNRSGNVTVLYGFIGSPDGADPSGGGLVKLDSYLYGTAARGGVPEDPGGGTIFRVKTDGSHFQILHTFYSPDGADPLAGLVSFDGSLFGTTAGGGAGFGTVFRIDPDGSNYSMLHAFADGPGDGSFPMGGLLPVSSSGGPPDVLYGTTYSGGIAGKGIVFKVDATGTVTKLFAFAGANGAFPQAEMINIPDTGGVPTCTAPRATAGGGARAPCSNLHREISAGAGRIRRRRHHR